MDEAIRTLIREKLSDGRLPYDSMPRFWGGPGDGEVCDACDKPITKQQLVMEASTLSDRPKDKNPIQFHVPCFEVWNDERRKPRANHPEVGAQALRRAAEISLREQAREAIQSGRLPAHPPDRNCVRYGRSGTACPVCVELVKHDEVEREIHFRRQGFGWDCYHLHPRCFAAWEFERTKQ